jgi:cytochrome c5
MKKAFAAVRYSLIGIVLMTGPVFSEETKHVFTCPETPQPSAGWAVDEHDCGDVKPPAAVYIQAISDDKKLETQYGLCCYEKSSLLRKAPPDFSVSGPEWKRILTNVAVTDRHIYRYACGDSYTKVSIEKCKFQGSEMISDPKLSAQMQFGEKVFKSHCSTCHKMDGLGMEPIIPGLKGDRVATGPIDRTIDTVMHGIPGTIMLSFHGKEPDDRLTDDEFAAVITYIRNAWGNGDRKRNGKDAGGSITAEEIQKRMSR